MASAMSPVQLYLEIGRKRTFAGALEWPGWSRSGRDETAALQALFDYGERYGRILHNAHIAFHAPIDPSAFLVIERHEGNATTDFGAPDIPLTSDRQPLDHADSERFHALLRAYWQAFDTAVQQATGKELRKGPRGGGRDLDKIVEHVLAADASYLRRLGRPFQENPAEDINETIGRLRQAILDGLAAAARGELPERGPRGGVIWPPRYFVRRSAWHLLDHLWEIEDRAG
jgi:hypothetical protein